MFDRDMRYLAASPKWLSDYGLKPPIVGQRHYDLCPDIGERWKAVHRRCLAGATESSAGERFERADGGAQWVKWEVRPWRDVSGAIGGVIIATEIVAAEAPSGTASEAREAEAGLSRSAMSDVGARIRGVRLHMDRSQQSFATFLGVAPETVARWESGQRLDRQALNLVADMTDTRIEWLIAGLAPARVAAIGAAVLADPGPGRAGLALALDERIRPQPVTGDRNAARAIAPTWKVRIGEPAGAAASAKASPAHSTSFFLHLPGATLWRGPRAARYRLLANRPPGGRPEIALSVVLRGRRRCEQLGRACEGGEGSGMFASSAEGGSAAYDPDGLYLTVFLPIEALSDRVPQLAQRLVTPVAPDAPELTLLVDYADALFQSEIGLDRDLAPTVADHFADLCALLLGAKGEERALARSRGLRAAQRAAIVQAIEADAATPGFSAQAVAERLGVAESEVHALMRDVGDWFWDRVNLRRVEIAKDRLAEPRFARMSVAEIALACGATDFEHFCRLFEWKYGVSPSAFRRTSKDAAT